MLKKNSSCITKFQPQRKVNMFLLLIALSLCVATEAQLGHEIENKLFPENSWTTLSCAPVARWNCSWEVRQDGASGFQAVEMESEFLRTPSSRDRLPGDVEIYLNANTMGTYRCWCRTNEDQISELRKEVYYYSQGKGVPSRL